ncbi:MAG: PocR ligand-binding domain-containing protein, partial [Pirellulales bacterium]|nr:PocR ligand-binding domain-containing protein [Pirellulales bacterium]
DVEAIQSIMDDFHYLTNMATAVLDSDGNIIEATGWQDICTKFHRINLNTSRNCTESDLYLAKNLKPGEYIDYKCKNGLWDVVTPLYVGTKHMGNIYTGQFFYDGDQIDEKEFVLRAKTHGFDETAYLEALHRIPRYSRETIYHLMSFLVKFTAYISKVGFANKHLEKEIRERKRSESALEKSEQQLRAIFRAATNVSFIITDAKDPEPTILEFSPGAERIFGYSKNEMVGGAVSVLHQKEDIANFPEAHRQMREGKTGFSGKTTLIRKSGENFPALFTTYPLLNRKGEMYASLGVSVDMTNQKKLENQLQQAQKLESIGTLAGGIAHDFNNILFPIVGHTEMLIEDIAEDSPFRDNLDEIYSAALRAKDLVKQILAFSHQDINEIKLMRIQPVIEDALKLIRSTIPTSIEMKQTIRKDCGLIKADPTQIHQVVMNLATNAYHAMEDTGGELNVGLREIELNEQDVINPEMKPGTYACLTVTDTGVGMDKDLIGKIFDPYFTTKETGKGTGMGLAVIHGIIHNAGGGINVYSEPGKGSEFHVYLPIVKSASEKQEPQTNEPLLRGTERILLVDDETAIITMEKQMLERLGYQVVSRTSSLEALEAFRANPDKFDLILTDMTMPNMSGDKLSSEMIKIRPNIPILLCTGFSEKMPEEKAASLGIKGFLMKPIVMKDLSKMIRYVLDNK